MSKAVKYSKIAGEIKKEYLKKHLSEVKNLVDKWIRELNPPSPFGRDRDQSSWGWKVIYRPSTEQDPDSNHMLRRHLKSRALWSHHANWERKLEGIWYSIKKVRQVATKIYVKKLTVKQRQYTEDFVSTALWQGFEAACGKVLQLDYKDPKNHKGRSFGAYVIETSVKAAGGYSLVEREHRDFSYEIAQTEEMKNLADQWSDVAKLQEAMAAIATKALKSSDILYPCQFCKHLWK